MNAPTKVLAYGAALMASATLASSAFAPQASAQARQASDCFRVQDITGISPVYKLGPDARDGVNIHVFKAGYYQLELLEPCGPALDDAIKIGVQARGGGSYICKSIDAEVITKGQTLRSERCTVTRLRKLDSAEVAKLSLKEKPL